MVDRRWILGGLLGLMGAAAAEAAEAARRRTSRRSTRRSRSRKPAPRPDPGPPPPPATTDPAVFTALTSMFDTVLDGLFAQSPIAATSGGFDKGRFAGQKSRIDDRSMAGMAANKARLQAAVNALRAFDRSKLSLTDRASYDSVLWDFETQLAGVSAFDFGDQANGQTFVFHAPSPYVISQLTGLYCTVPDFLATQHAITEKADADAYVARLEAFAAALDQETERFKAETGRGIIPPDFVIDVTLKQLRAIRGEAAEADPLVTTLAARTQAAGLVGDWALPASAVVAGKLQPAFDRQIAAVEAVRARAKPEAGVYWMPMGESYYTWAARTGTSTSLTPREIHTIGLEKAAEILSELDARLKALGFSQGTPGERIAAMSKDPQYLYPNTDEGKAQLLADLNVKVADVTARLPKYFGTVPKTAATIKRIPVATEAGAPGGYYQPAALDGSRAGAYYINLRDTAEHPKFSLSTLTYHEAVPGHHMQISLQQEAKGLHNLRKLGGFNAYVEGWALYSEQLAVEMGLYDDDPVGRIGYLNDALFRAARLVVDTGMHALGWSKAQAMAYMKATIGDENETEINRYCVWPGQALGYMVGKIKWLDLRAASTAKKGSNFDIKVFHDTGLLNGAMPLAVLEQVYKDKGLI